LLVLISLSLIVAVVLVVAVLVHFSKDLRSIYQTSNEDYERLISNEFFEKHNSEKDMFEKIKNRLNEKVLSAYRMIQAQYWSTGAIVSALLGFAAYNQDIYVIQSTAGVILFFFLLLLTAWGSNLIEKPE
jgi:hypothetical protein